jgi:hypothetical protein
MMPVSSQLRIRLQASQQFVGDGRDCVIAAKSFITCLVAHVEVSSGYEPLPDDEGPRQAKAMMGVLLPAFEAEFQQH